MADTTEEKLKVMDPWEGFTSPDQHDGAVGGLDKDGNTVLLSSSAAAPLRSRLSSFRARVSERMAESKTRSQSASAAAEEATKKQLEEKAAAKLTELQEEDYETLRPSRISVSVIKDENQPYGFSIDQKKGERLLKRSVVINSLVEYGLLHKSPLKEGDCLTRVNSVRVSNADACTEQLVGLTGHVTLEAETPQGNPALVAAFCRKPSPDYTSLGVRFVNTEHVHETEDHNNDEDVPQETTPEASTTTTTTTTTTTKSTITTTRLLQIGDLNSFGNGDSSDEIGINNDTSAGLLADSVLRAGDLVLAINGTPCANMSAEEASKLVREAEETVTIVALNPQAHATATGPTRAQRFMRQAKRTSIAVGGGSMVGVGLLLIPTVPPPFGEILIAGGVTVLSTEFEAPKRVVRSARDSLEMSVGREEVPANEDEKTREQDKEDEARETNSSEQVKEGSQKMEEHDDCKQEETEAIDANNNPPKWRRLKSFGRNYVLPFLDQVVGDRKHEDEGAKEELKDSPSSSPSTPSTETSEAAGTSEDFQDQHDDESSLVQNPTPAGQSVATGSEDISVDSKGTDSDSPECEEEKKIDR